MTDTEHARSGWRIKPVRVHLRFGPAAHLPARGEAVAVPRRRGHRAHLAVRRAPVGVARRPAAAAHGRRRRRRLHGHRGRGRARPRRTRGAARLPHRRPGRGAPRRPRELALPAGRRAYPTHRREDRRARSSSPASTSSCSPCRARACPPPSARSARASATARPSSSLSKGLVPPLGTTPAAYVGERVRARAVASLAGPAHAREAIELGALGRRRHARPGPAPPAARPARGRRPDVEATDDVTGAELAACAKNAAALAAAAAAPRGPNLAGAAAGRSSPRSTSSRWRAAPAARPSPGSPAPVTSSPPRSPRAAATGARARWSAQASPAGRSQASMDQTAESLATVPLLARRARAPGHRRAGHHGLAACSVARSRRGSGSRRSLSARPRRRRTHAA